MNLYIWLVLDTSKDEEVSYNVDKVTLKPLDRLRNSIGGLMLMIGGEGQNGQEVEVISGKGKEVVRVNVDYLSNHSVQQKKLERVSFWIRISFWIKEINKLR